MMEKTIFEQMVGTYEQQSNYFIIVGSMSIVGVEAKNKKSQVVSE